MSLLLSKYQRYVHLTPNERYEEYRALEKHLLEFCSCLNIKPEEIICKKDVIFDIIERVEMRQVYFHIFHNKIMSERNAISNTCFWIMKLSPLLYKPKPSQPTNTFFAIYLFLKMLKKVSLAKQKTITFNQDFIKNITYAFIYRDISKEAIMAISDALLAGI
ncbi:hypothetical protein R80B4_02735 [Fibrobacteres bacterium R8-0-B4]